MIPPEEHHRYREQIGAFLLGKLDGGERTVMQTHLNSCLGCQAEMRELEPVVAALADAAPDRIEEEPWPLEDLEELTLAPILGEIHRARRRRRRSQRSALAAAAICVVAIGLAGFTWLLEPAFTLELREDAVRLEIRTRSGELVFFAKLPEEPGVADPERPEEPSDPAPPDTQEKPKDAGSGGKTPPKGSSPESDPKRSPPGGASSAFPDSDAAPGAGGQESVPPDAGKESGPPDAGQESASPAAGKQAASVSASPAADQYQAQP